MMTTRRCAVYTRKSSEEGLEQDFNSLHAQREACEAFIRSQRSEGWRLIETGYDDGGISGGTLERPGLRHLLADIEHRRVDTVVVYKVDRLTRSLMDFAKLVELFDRHGVTFVAVTQQFNTTSSMGSLTLNILLSFAQFEREVIGERVRDKIAASKKKGMWMGGVPPLGYAVTDRRLTIITEEAEQVRLIFQRYLELGSVRLLQQQLDQDGMRSKRRRGRNGSGRGGLPFSRGALYTLLSNPLYIGEISHKGIRYPGQHEALLDRKTWDAAQAQLRSGTPHRKGRRVGSESPLIGKLFDEAGHRLTPSHAAKAGRRYRYYVSRPLITGTAERSPGAWRLPASQVEKMIAGLSATVLSEKAKIAAVLESAGISPKDVPAAFAAVDRVREQLLSDAGQTQALRTIIERVELSPLAIQIVLSLRSVTAAAAEPVSDDALLLSNSFPLRIRRRGVEMRFVFGNPQPRPASAPDPKLLTELRRAHRCFAELASGRVNSMRELATMEGVKERHISSILPLAFLAPDIVEAIAAGKQSPEWTTRHLTRGLDLPIDWSAQRRLLWNP